MCKTLKTTQDRESYFVTVSLTGKLMWHPLSGVAGVRGCKGSFILTAPLDLRSYAGNLSSSDEHTIFSYTTELGDDAGVRIPRELGEDLLLSTRY